MWRRHFQIKVPLRQVIRTHDTHTPYDNTLYEVVLLLYCFVIQRNCGATCVSAGPTHHIQRVAAGRFRGGSIVMWWRMGVSASELEGCCKAKVESSAAAKMYILSLFARYTLVQLFLCSPSLVVALETRRQLLVCCVGLFWKRWPERERYI